MKINKLDITELNFKKTPNLKYYEFNQKIFIDVLPVSKEIIDLAKSIPVIRKDHHKTNYFEEKPKEINEKGQKIFEHFQSFFSKILNYYTFKEFITTHWWIQRYDKNDNHDLHTHGHFMNELSYIIYLQCSPQSAKTVFYMPGYPYIQIGDPLKIQPQSGMCVLFPSYMPHSVEPNNDSDRIIMSGNIKVIE